MLLVLADPQASISSMNIIAGAWALADSIIITTNQLVGDILLSYLQISNFSIWNVKNF